MDFEGPAQVLIIHLIVNLLSALDIHSDLLNLSLLPWTRADPMATATQGLLPAGSPCTVSACP